MINKISSANVYSIPKFNAKPQATSPISNNSKVVSFGGAKSISGAQLASAYQALNGIRFASSVPFTGNISLQEAFTDLNAPMVTCADPLKGRKGESVGSRVDVSALADKFADSLPKYDDAVKTNVEISRDDKEGIFTEARTQVKNRGEEGLLYQMSVRQPREIGTVPERTDLKQDIKVLVTPDSKLSAPMDERAYVLNTKGNLMSVIEDNEKGIVLMTDTGNIVKADGKNGLIRVDATKGENVYKPFEVAPQIVRERKPEASKGAGTEIVIGMEEGRFVPEIIDSIREFEQKINDGEIVLDTFVAMPNAQNAQIAMLAGGFGSRAEYTNASSDGIFHGVEGGAQSTKGVFRTSTGLTPMETTFITLHNAGLLDCSKGNFGIGKNVKFYLNQSGVNKGNGGFTVDLYDKMARSGRENLFIFPNDPISRVTQGVKDATEIMNSGKAAVVMIAKEVDPADAYQFGVMQLDDDNHIVKFVEKPKVVDPALIKDGACLANTFQFAVSKEAFEALDILAPFFPAGQGKEPRDWSKCLTPILMSLTQEEDLEKIQKSIAKVVDTEPENIPVAAIAEAKDVLGEQKIFAVPTSEPWADCGNLNALYKTTMDIAAGNFPVEDFERAHVLDSVDTMTGLVATTPELKEAVEDKYSTYGQVMVAPIAKKVDPSIIQEYIDKGAVTINPKQV